MTLQFKKHHKLQPKAVVRFIQLVYNLIMLNKNVGGEGNTLKLSDNVLGFGCSTSVWPLHGATLLQVCACCIDQQLAAVISPEEGADMCI